MFTVSCYAFHPLIQRFVRLWRYVQIVSDVLTFFLSMLCCQCMEAMPMSTSTSCGTKPSVQVFKCNEEEERTKVDVVDPGKSSGEPLRPQHLVIDFTPGREDTPEIQAKCQQFWQFAKNKPELGGMMVHPPPDTERRLIDLSSTMVHQEPNAFRNNNNLPAIHMMRKMNKKGVVKAALNSGQVNDTFYA